MICDHPQCTGIHGHNTPGIWHVMCPGAIKKSREKCRRHRDIKRMSYLKSLLQNRRYKAMKRRSKRMEQYGKV